MAEPGLVAGPSACQYEVWARIAGLVIPASLLVAALLFVAGGGGAALAAGLTAVVVLAAVASTAFMILSGRTIQREKAAGYSTVYDFAGYELRDPKTLALIRPADEAPTGTMRRSLLRAMLTVKPNTVLSKRLDDED